MDKTDWLLLANATNIVLQYMNSRPHGDSYWLDEDGNYYKADIGYAGGYLEDVRDHAVDMLIKGGVIQDGSTS